MKSRYKGIKERLDWIVAIYHIVNNIVGIWEKKAPIITIGGAGKDEIHVRTSLISTQLIGELIEASGRNPIDVRT